MKMKVLVVTPSVKYEKEVGAIRMSSLIRYMIDNSFEVVVLTDKRNYPVFIDGVYLVKYVDTGSSSLNANEGINCFRNNMKAYAEGFKNVINSCDIGVVIISGGPFYTFHISVLSKKRSIPCILDFRDPWFFDVREKTNFKSVSFVLKSIYKYCFESRAIGSADKVVTVTEIWRKKFIKFYPFQSRKFCLIENGYDDNMLDSIELVHQEVEGISIGVFGKLFYYTEKYSNIFLNAIKNMDDIKINQIGDREHQTDYLLKKYGLPIETIISTGFIEYKEGIKRLNCSNVLLIIDAREGALGTKVYDYIYLNKPILYVGPRNTALAELVGGFENGFICTNETEVIESISLIKEKKITILNKNNIKRYGRNFQNSKWIELIRMYE